MMPNWPISRGIRERSIYEFFRKLFALPDVRLLISQMRLVCLEEA